MAAITEQGKARHPWILASYLLTSHQIRRESATDAIKQGILLENAMQSVQLREEF